MRWDELKWEKAIFLTITAFVTAIVVFIADDAAIIVIDAIIHHMEVNIFDVLNGVDRSDSSGSTSHSGIFVVDRSAAAAAGNVAVAIHIIDIVNAVHFKIVATIGAISAG